MIATAQDVLDFWFDAQVQPKWFNSGEAFDQSLTARFEPTWQAAVRGELDRWAASAQGALALVIVLDQFPLNMYRGRPESFVTEAKAREIAGEAIAKGFDQSLPPAGKAFLYLPFMHSETLADQDRSVELYHAAGLLDNLRFAQHHRELIRRFGRFPHRNAILGRASTSEELAYLASDAAFSG